MAGEDALDWDEFYRSWGMDDQADAVEETQETLGFSDEFWQAGVEDANDPLPEQVAEDLSDWEDQEIRDAERAANDAADAAADAADGVAGFAEGVILKAALVIGLVAVLANGVRGK
jgi:hypothetical protein